MPIKNVLRKLADQESHFEDVNVAVARASERLISAAMLGPDEVLAQLEASREGLPEEAVSDRLARFGKNEVAHETMPAWYRQFVKAWINPFVGILVALAITAYFTEVVFAPPGEQEYASLIIITILILISVLLTFAQEYQASKAADELLTLVQTTTTVQRPLTGRVKVATNQIVPGDIVHLAAGDIIPADVYLLATNNLSVNEAALTGESLPVEKSHTAVFLPDAAAQAQFRQTANPLDLDNIGFMGTHVVSGTAEVAVTANLAKGTVEMARQKTIVKRLSAIQNLGAINILCTDKTGTLTQDSVGLETYLNVAGEPDAETLRYAYLNSYHQTGLSNPMDEAVLAHEDAQGLASLAQAYPKVAEIPFETARRRMSVVVADEDGRHLLICKGATAEMFAISSAVKSGDQIVPLTGEMRTQIAARADDLNEEGLRVLLVAYKVEEPRQQAYRAADEQDLTLVGFIGFLDPEKESAGPAIAALQERGVQVKVITGDNEIVTRRICREIDLPVEGLLQGYQVDQMSDEELGRAVEEVNIFVRMAPLQKSRVVQALKANEHTVGFLGDGINDAPALRDADVGISVDNAVDIAKESADIILLEKDLLVLSEGVGRGRHVFGNIMKYIKITASSNFGNVFSVLVASAFLPFSPMLPLHLLIQNLLYDISQISIPWDNVDEEYVQAPRKWNPGSIARFMLVLGPVSSIFDFSTFALMWYVFGANSPAEQSLFHAGWFILGLLSQTLIFHMIRTSKVPFVQSIASKPVLLMTGLVMAVGLILPFTAYGTAVGFEAPPPSYFPWLLLTLIAYCVVIQFVKVWYIRRFKMWL